VTNQNKAPVHGCKVSQSQRHALCLSGLDWAVFNVPSNTV